MQFHVVLQSVAPVEPLRAQVAGERHLSAVDQIVLLKTKKYFLAE